jgi:putative transposase
LLRFGRDQRRWIRWLYQARVRPGLCVLNYVATSNHVHLVVRDRERGEVAASMQLLAGCTGQAYNRRKQRHGAFWQDRYHATAAESAWPAAWCTST